MYKFGVSFRVMQHIVPNGIEVFGQERGAIVGREKVYGHFCDTSQTSSSKFLPDVKNRPRFRRRSNSRNYILKFYAWLSLFPLSVPSTFPSFDGSYPDPLAVFSKTRIGRTKCSSATSIV